MKRSTGNPPGTKTHFICLVLSYSLLISLCAPLTFSRAATTVVSPATKVSFTPSASTGASPTAQQTAQRADELLVRFRPGVPEQEKNAVAASKGAERRGRLRGASGFERLNTGGQTPQSLMAQLAMHPTVEWVEPNFLIRRDDLTLNNSANQLAGYLPDMPRNTEPWARGTVGSAPGHMGGGLAAPAPREPMTVPTPTAGTEMLVAVVDSGIDFTHPDLAASRWENPSERANERDDDRDGYTDDLNGWDWVEGGNRISDVQGHGTSVAGLISAEVSKAAGTTGASGQLRLMSLRVLDGAGTGDVADAVEAIDYAMAHGARVINLSWGLETESLALREALRRAGNSGVVVVCSAGNDGRNIDGAPYYPASYALQNIIAVAASDSTDNLASWSNWGATHVTIAAPGVEIPTTKMGGGEQQVTGTSAAAPQVSGIAALVRDSYPGLGGADTRAAIVRGARRVPELSGKVFAGGVAHAAGALSAAGGIVAGTGGGSGNGSGNNGNGNNGQWRGASPPPERPTRGSGGRGPGGSFDAPASPPTKAAPPNFMNQNEARRRGQIEPQARAFIQSNLLPACDADCEGYSVGGAGGSDPYFGTARNLPGNRTGQTAGVDLGSRNFNWGVPLVSLAGRAGLDLNIALYYNSLVWTKQGNSIQYNADHGFPGPGFRLGFPTLQPIYYNSNTGAYAYTMVTSSGGRVTMQQIAGTNTYESTDGSYTHLTANSTGAPFIVRMSDGTQLNFVFNSTVNEFRCTQIKDRNGNFITINYDAINGNSSLGRPTSVVDTAGRTINFNYDGQNYLSSITQSWVRETPAGVVSEPQREWARFYYGTVTLQPNFPELNVLAPVGTAVPVLMRVDLQDKSSFQFEYEAAWGMVRRISHYGSDPGSRLINYTSYNLPTNETPHWDCPRFTQQRYWAQDWNNNLEAVTTYALAENHTWTMDNVQHAGTRTTVTTPAFTDKDGVQKQVVSKVYAHSTGWDTGLPLLEETYEKTLNGAETVRRTSKTYWTQDDTTLSYAKNPRPWETHVSDPEQTPKRTRIDYTSYSLPAIIYEYGADAQTLVRQTNFAYNLSQAYLDKRIIGLASVKEVYDVPGGYAIVSRTTYDYDSGALENGGTVWRHDGTTYGAGVVTGRGNLTAVHRFDVTAPYDTTKMASVSTGYDTAGNVVWTRDGENHLTSIGYADNYSQGPGNLNTRAYPTQVTVADPANYSSTAQYNYDLGAAYLATDPKGAAQKTHYDSAGRLLRVTRVVNGADGFYTRYEYDPNRGHTRSYTPTETGEAYTNSITNGAGQVYLFVASHPNSVGGYLATQTKYDALGRAVEQSNPTEIYGDGTPAGDDAYNNGVGGYRWTKQAYDWKGRPTLTTFPAVAGQSLGNTRELSYTNCGCAGGEVTTFRDERGRRRVLSKDVLGRLVKVEEMNWLESQGVYSTTTYAYNMRDQIVSINQAGQVRTLEYDGHGRLWKRTTPEQGLTTYLYNKDDTTQSMTDARGVTTAFVYNNRRLVKNINYSVPAGSTAMPTGNVAYEYDAAGNRTSMTDGLGSVSYVYNTLSQLTSETRHFDGAAGPQAGGFQLSYHYNQAGELARVTNPWNAQAAYTYDANGRVTDVRGTDANGAATYMGVQNYALNLRYRAFGGLKGLSHGNGQSTLALTYDERLRLKTWNVAGVLGWNYHYDKLSENSHRVTYAQNISSSGTTNGDPTLDRSFEYDQVGRLQYSHSGVEARMHAFNQQNDGGGYGPYAHHYYYDVWGNITGRIGWGGANSQYTATYTNNRRDGMGYDFSGNLTNEGGQTFQYDATGQQTYASATGLSQGYDGDGLRVRKAENGATTYYLRSSVLGGRVICEIDAWGTWQRGYVYLGGQMLAIQQAGVKWVHQDPIVKSQRVTDFSGALQATVELDPWGGETNRSEQQWQQPQRFTSYLRDGNESDEAMMRRYNRRWSRFDQPDPYDGSYDVADPQSLNRYSYVQNDPVNYVDPSGLLMASPRCTIVWVFKPHIEGGGDWILQQECGYEFYGSDTGRRGPPDIEAGGSGEQPQGPTPAPPDDCNRFADMVQAIANRVTSAARFFDEFARTFTAANNSGLREIQRTRENAIPEGRPTFGDGGFKSEFRDGSNQVRHFSAVFLMSRGLPFGELSARGVMNLREYLPGGNDQDIALNKAAANLGGKFSLSKLSAIRGQLAAEIRGSICEPRSWW